MPTAYPPILLQFPLRGQWLSPNTPGTKIPSHGTDRFGTTYAYDFIQVDWDRPGRPAYRVGFLHYLLLGVPLNKYYCWGQPVYSPCDGRVVAAQDGYEERSRTSLWADTVRAYRSAHAFDPATDGIQAIAGNYVIIAHDAGVYVALCHLQTGSVQVATGQRIKTGQLLGRVGHSGNSYAPHLHFQVMDSPHIATAKGLPCAFETYEVYREGRWETVQAGIPTNRDRIRFEV